MTDWTPRSILITGASSGIGAALAQAYAIPSASLALSGRDAGRLARVAEACRQAGAEVAEAPLDVTDAGAVEDWIGDADGRAPVDLVIANAGVSAGTSGVPGGEGLFDESDAQVRRIFDVNFNGLLNTVFPALARMRARGHGQLALMASLASFRGLPGAAAYSASKAAIRSYGEALRVVAAGNGIGVTVICPGFVASRITAQNHFPMPFFMTAEAAAALIKRRLARNPARIAFPWPLYAGTLLLAALPPALTDPLLARRSDRHRKGVKP